MSKQKTTTKKSPRRRPPKFTPETLETFLDFLVTTPRLSRAAEHVGIHHKTPFDWIARSMRGDPEFEVMWMGRKAQFAKHIIIARELSKVALDHSARDQGINGWRELKTGPNGPIWKVDPKIAADAMAMTELDWELEYWPRKRADVYLRDNKGALVQDWIDHPPNPQLLNKLLGSLLKDVYGDHSVVEHVGSVGHVWIGGEPDAIASGMPGKIASTPGENDPLDAFGITTPVDPTKRPNNTLALPAPIKSQAEFDAKFMRKLLREVSIFRNPAGKVEPPLDDDIVVEGSWQHREFAKAGIEVKTHAAVDLIEDGYRNDFLFTLCPQAAYAKPDKAELYAINEGDSELVKDMKRRAAGGVKNPLPLDKHGHRTMPKLSAGNVKADDPPERLSTPGVGVSAETGDAQQVGLGREQLGRGQVAPGGYSASPPNGRPRGFIR